MSALARRIAPGLVGIFSLSSALAASTVTVDGAYARATVPGQMASGAFMTLRSDDAVRLVGVSTPVAGVAQVDEMSMDGTTMKMRAVDGVDLPAGKPVELKPGGIHVMLMDLKRPLKAGDSVSLTLRIEGADHRVVEQVVPVEVRAPR